LPESGKEQEIHGWLRPCRHFAIDPQRRQKNGGACGTAKFREETSKKADSAVKDRIAAVHNLAQGHSHASKISHCSIVFGMDSTYMRA